MKKICSFLAIVCIILVSNCSKIPENNDPVIGIWIDPLSGTSLQAGKNTSRQEWIFNDAYLGRFHRYTNKELSLKTDFKWTKEKDVYLISYPGTDLPDQQVILEDLEDGTILKDHDGTVVAVRQ
ncbi:hypothetical protein U1E44_03380 [Arenibacter sp. GZD96]|uniref:hypothetical protein n=1 Tax=Aurantibrevibacter litoralis TaxID=3106030 RepID=UPI002AFEB40F|nr:hypothetical protein [Arenibacter sp. GZD-96]MEA1785120.1 hypothetical protein [Arenibacter sp. GZD-96]